jgi:hypothetical protein
VDAPEFKPSGPSTATPSPSLDLKSLAGKAPEFVPNRQTVNTWDATHPTENQWNPSNLSNGAGSQDSKPAAYISRDDSVSTVQALEDATVSTSSSQSTPSTAGSDQQQQPTPESPVDPSSTQFPTDYQNQGYYNDRKYEYNNRPPRKPYHPRGYKGRPWSNGYGGGYGSPYNPAMGGSPMLQPDGSIPVQPLLTSSGHLVLMTETGLVVPSENFVYPPPYAYGQPAPGPMYMPPAFDGTTYYGPPATSQAFVTASGVGGVAPAAGMVYMPSPGAALTTTAVAAPPGAVYGPPAIIPSSSSAKVEIKDPETKKEVEVKF